MAPRLALLKAALCLAALHAHCATAYATENCVICGDDEATRCPGCRGCDGSYIFEGLVTVDCSYEGIVSLAPQPLNDTLPEGTGRLRLDNNQLATLTERVFAGLASLRILNLFGNQLATLPERVFEGLASLKELCVRARVVVCAAARVAAGGARGLRRCWRRAPTDALPARRAANALSHALLRSRPARRAAGT